jgi:deoxyribonuclease V
MRYHARAVLDTGPSASDEMSSQWPATADALVAAQRELAAGCPEPWRWRERSAVAGCFVCFGRGRVGPGATGDPGWAAAALVVGDDLAGIAIVTGAATAPYVPGLLALRDGPLLEAAVLRLPALPDVLLVNATGRDHPRRAGLALHLGARFGIPTVGVTTEPLVARGDWPGEEPGAFAVIRVGHEVVGCWLRARQGVRPLAVHPGWRTDLETAVAVVTATTRQARTPEPLRQARRAARTARAAGTPCAREEA